MRGASTQNKSADPRISTHTTTAHTAHSRIHCFNTRIESKQWSTQTCRATAVVSWPYHKVESLRALGTALYSSSNKSNENKKLKCGVPAHQYTDPHAPKHTHTYHSTQQTRICLLYTSPSPRDKRQSRMPSSA